MYSPGGMSSHGALDEPFCSWACGDGARAAGAAFCCGAPGVGTLTTTRGAAGLGVAGAAAGLAVEAAAVARPRSDDTFRPALRNTLSASLAPPARRGGMSAAGCDSCDVLA